MELNRRGFLGCMAAAAVAGGVRGAVSYRTQLKKSLIRKRLDGATADGILAAGFKGVELSDRAATVAEARAAYCLARERGITIHSFMGGWFEFNHADATVRRAQISECRRSIELAAEYGAPVVLVVPGKIGGPMPAPHEFELEFDPATLELKRAAKAGDFSAYVHAQNAATGFARDALCELAPYAAECGVIIGVENVWNNLWVKPDFASSFVRSFHNPWIKTYLDLGNHVRYAPVEEWLSWCSDQIVKLHMKDFRIDRSLPNGGEFVAVGKGSIDWKRVRRAIDGVGYSGWVSVEENKWTDAEYAVLMDRFFRGEL